MWVPASPHEEPKTRPARSLSRKSSHPPGPMYTAVATSEESALADDLFEVFEETSDEIFL